MAAPTPTSDHVREQQVSITPLLRRLWPSPAKENVTPSEIALAISHIFTDSLSPVQTGALLTALHFTGWDRRADVIARCAAVMRDASAPVDTARLRAVARSRGRSKGNYRGGLCDIVGTGGDSHNTFNVSTSASIVASAELLVAKHGNRASTSNSGSADLLSHASSHKKAPEISAVTPTTLVELYEGTNYGFLFAPVFHPGMRYVAPIRKELGWRTIFNLLGPLANPAEDAIEARLVGVARRDLGPVFAEALKISGARKALVVCGEEDLDEISCAGRTYCWMLTERERDADAASLKKDSSETEPNGHTEEGDVGPEESDDCDGHPASKVETRHFVLTPSDFGLPTHPLNTVSPGKSPSENAAILLRLLRNELPPADPILHFVLMNAAALLVAAGVCETGAAEGSHEEEEGVMTERGPGGQRWKDGLRRARIAVESGAALKQWEAYVETSHRLAGR